MDWFPQHLLDLPQKIVCMRPRHYFRHDDVNGEVEEFPEIIGESSVMKEVFVQINQVAKTDASVLIQGESGTGKELIAKAIHEKSNFAKGPFIRFNCAALPETSTPKEYFHKSDADLPFNNSNPIDFAT